MNLFPGSSFFKNSHKFKKGLSYEGVFNGWYFVQVIQNISVIQYHLIEKQCNVTFNEANQIENGWYKMNLNNDQATCIEKTCRFNLYKYMRKKLHNNDMHDDYIIKTSEKFNKGKYHISKYSNNHYILKNASVAELENDTSIINFQKYTTPVLHNRYTSEYILRGREDGNYWDHPRYVNGAVLDGSGQVVTVTDSGIDMFNPFFYDHTVPLVINYTNFSHRKIVRFDALTNFTDNYNGHGTHVAGTIAGKIIDADSFPNLYNGIAPEAKLYVVGISDSTRNLNFQDYNLEEITKKSYGLNSYIMSNSWGYLEDQKLMTKIYDTHAYENQEMIQIFSSGNSREISSPSDSKNVISVSATSQISMRQIESRPLRVYSIQGSSNAVNVTRFYWSKDPLDDEKESLGKRIDRIFITDDPDDSERPDTFLLIKKKFNCQNLISDHFRGYLIPSDITCRIPTHPVFLYNKSDLKKLEDMTSATVAVLPLSYKPITMLKSTGGGITKTGIIKPDLAAPGESIISARAGIPEVEQPRSASKAMTTKTGTSMAVPAISGTAALLRQFFIDRYKCAPSGHLLKALLILAARPLHGRVLDDYSGFGIPVVGDIVSKPLAFADRKPIFPETNQTYRVRVTKQCRLSFVLSYFDPPSKGRRPLTADLDLLVVTPSGFTLRSNEQPSGDSFATSEKILLENTEPGTYTVSVVAGRFQPRSAVNYSIAISGELAEDGEIAAESVGPLRDCGSDYKTGFICETDIRPVYTKFKMVEPFQSKEIKFFRLTNIQKVNIRAQGATVHFCTSKRKPLRISDFDTSCDYTNKSVALKVCDCYLMVYAVTLSPVRVGIDFVPRKVIAAEGGEIIGPNEMDSLDVICGIALASMLLALLLRICCKKHRKKYLNHSRRRSDSGSSLLNSYSSYSNPLSISDDDGVFLAPPSSLP